MTPKEASAYEQGFMDKCAEYGVDPGMVKQAVNWAGMGGKLQGLYGKAKGGLSRYFDLMRGGNKEFLSHMGDAGWLNDAGKMFHPGNDMLRAFRKDAITAMGRVRPTVQKTQMRTLAGAGAGALGLGYGLGSGQRNEA